MGRDLDAAACLLMVEWSVQTTIEGLPVVQLDLPTLISYSGLEDASRNNPAAFHAIYLSVANGTFIVAGTSTPETEAMIRTANKWIDGAQLAWRLHTESLNDPQPVYGSGRISERNSLYQSALDSARRNAAATDFPVVVNRKTLRSDDHTVAVEVRPDGSAWWTLRPDPTAYPPFRVIEPT